MELLIAALEKNRRAFIKLFKTTKIVNNVVLALLVLGMGATFLWLFPVDLNLSLIVIGALIIGLFVYSRAAKSWLGKKAYEYIFEYYRVTSSHFYSEAPFSDIVIEARQGFELEEFKTLGVLTNEVGIVSRNRVSGKIHERDFQISDAGVRVEADRKVEVAFFGKIIKFELHEPISGRFIVHHRLKQDASLPAGFATLQSLSDDEGLLVFGNEEKTPKFMKKTFYQALRGIVPDELLADVTFVAFEGHAYLLLSYADAIMNVVYQEVADEKALKRFAADLEKIVALAQLLP